jgi:hypothetical protein
MPNYLIDQAQQGQKDAEAEPEFECKNIVPVMTYVISLLSYDKSIFQLLLLARESKKCASKRAQRSWKGPKLAGVTRWQNASSKRGKGKDSPKNFQRTQRHGETKEQRRFRFLADLARLDFHFTRQTLVRFVFPESCRADGDGTWRR